MSQHLLEEQVTASEIDRGPDPGGGQDLVEEQVTASEVDRGPDPGAGEAEDCGQKGSYIP